MKIKFVKTLSFVLIILFISISPLGSYCKSVNSCVYAYEDTIENTISKYVIPASALMVLTYEQASQGYDSFNYTVSTVSGKIKEMVNSGVDWASKVPAKSKAIVAKVFTELTTEQINTGLGTSYSDAELGNYAQSLISHYQSNTVGSYQDIYDMGITHLFANSIKSYSNLGFNGERSVDTTYTPLGYVYRFTGKCFSKEFTGYKVKAGINYNYMRDLGVHLINSSLTITDADGYCYAYKIVSTYYLGNKVRIRLSMNSSAYSSGSSGFILGDAKATICKENILFPNSPGAFRSADETDYVYIDSLINGTWTQAECFQGKSLILSMKTLIDKVLYLTGFDLTGSSLYSESLSYSDVFPLTFIGAASIPGTQAGSISLNIPALDSGFWTGEDVSKTDAERVIEAVGTSATTWDVEVGTNTVANDDPDTNIDLPFLTDVVLSPTTDMEVPDVDTGDPDSGSGTGNPDDTSGILKWLKSFWELLKSLWEKLWSFLAQIIALLTSIFTNIGNLSGSSEGIDWGNFKGLFDIFYIFYYLIIIIVMILLKLLSVVWNMFDIPANATLFNSYPTMLAGLNYIKNIKVGGFNITLQQIFEYMFTVFFFVSVVAVLQKLYHSFQGVERQELREQQHKDRS